MRHPHRRILNSKVYSERDSDGVHRLDTLECGHEVTSVFPTPPRDGGGVTRRCPQCPQEAQAKMKGRR